MATVKRKKDRLSKTKQAGLEIEEKDTCLSMYEKDGYEKPMDRMSQQRL